MKLYEKSTKNSDTRSKSIKKAIQNCYGQSQQISIQYNVAAAIGPVMIIFLTRDSQNEIDDKLVL